jgi:hypothetical protein
MKNLTKPGQRPSKSRAAFDHAEVREPSISDLLSEPIVQAVMKADGVSAEQIVSILAQARPPGGEDSATEVSAG